MQASFVRGLYDPPANQSASIAGNVFCPTGNCTFPESGDGISFQTLDMCHLCADVSKNLVAIPPATQFGVVTYNLTGGYLQNITMNATTQDGKIVTGNLLSFFTDDAAVAKPVPNGPGNHTDLMSIQGITYTSVPTNCTSVRNCSYKPFVFECSFSPCVKSYSAGVVNGQYTETGNEAERQYLHNVYSVSRFELGSNRTYINGTWQDCAPLPNKTDTHNLGALGPEANQIGFNATNAAQLYYRPECYYSIGPQSYQALSQNMPEQIYKGSVTYMTSSFRGDAWAKTLWGEGNITMKAVDQFAFGLASSVGAEMRRTGDTYDETTEGEKAMMAAARGDATETFPCFTVRWKYLSFLATLWACTFYFTIAIVTAHMRSSVSGIDWKTSSLPLLFQAMPDGDGLPSSGQFQQSELRRRAEGTNVELVDSDGQWILQRR